jgi:hypothetical protein
LRRNTVSTSTLSLPRRRFTEVDLLLISIWCCFAFVAAHVNVSPFIVYALAGGAVLIARHLYSVVFKGGPSKGDLVIAAAAPMFLILSSVGLWCARRYTVVTYDPLLARMDLGVAAAVRTWAQARGRLMQSLTVCYLGLPFAMVIAAAAARAERRVRFLYSISLGAVLAVPCYMILPAVGPAHVGDPRAVPNCMPSMHMTWSLLIFTSLRGRAKWPAGAYAAIMALATIATGEHYMPDLIAALPWTWALNRLAEGLPFPAAVEI